ncbi:6885_t:CDS:2, partial [Funneliformis geosporum]
MGTETSSLSKKKRKGNNEQSEDKEAQNLSLVSQEKASTFIPPRIEFSPFASSSKTTTSAVGKASRKVLLWEEFFEEVNRYTFDQHPTFKEPTFHYKHLLNKESSVLTATDAHNGKNYDFSDRSVCIPGLDFTCYYIDEKLIL